MFCRKDGVIKNLIFLELFKRHPLLVCFNDNYHQFYHLVEKKGFILQTNSESFNLKTKLNVEKMSCNCQRHQIRLWVSWEVLDSILNHSKK